MVRHPYLLVVLLMAIAVFPVHAQDRGSPIPITRDNAADITQVALLGHGWINQIAWSPDGGTLAVASSAGVWLHDMAQPDAAPGHLETGADVWSVAFSPDGRLLAAGTRNMWVYVWEMDTLNGETAPQPVSRQYCASGDWYNAVESVAFNADGTVLACASDGVMFWDMTTDQLLADTPGLPDYWGDKYVAFSPDGSTLATTGTSSKTAARKPGLVRQWDLKTHELLTSWTLTEGQSGTAVAYSPDSAWLAVAGSAVEVRDAATGEVRYTLENTSGTRSLAYSPDGTVLVTAGYELALWDAVTGQRLAGPTFDNQAFVRCFGEDTGQPWTPCPANYDVLSVAISPDNMLAAADAAGRVGVWDIRTGEPVSALSGYNFGGAERGGASSDTIGKGVFAFSPDGTTLAAGATGYMTSGGWVELWDVEQQAIQGHLEGYGSMTALAYSPVKDLLLTASAWSGIQLWDVQTGTVQHVLLDYGEAAGDAAFSPDGSLVAVGLVYGEIDLRDTATGESVAVLTTETEYMTSIAFSPDGALLAAGTYEGTVPLWDVRRHELLSTFVTQDDWISCVAVSPQLLDGRLVLATGGGYADGMLHLWAVGPEDGSAQELAVMQTGIAGVTGLAFTPDGSVLVSGDRGGGVMLWDARTGEKLVTLHGHSSDFPVGVALSPDGTLLATGGGDGSIRLWGPPH
jgi:WD40 repeat protein